MRPVVLIVNLLILLIAGTLLWMYIFSIYEVRFETSELPGFKGTRRVCIKTIALNSLGKQAPFRNSESRFEIISGIKEVAKFKADKYSAVLDINENPVQSIKVKAASDYSLFETVIELNSQSESVKAN